MNYYKGKALMGIGELEERGFKHENGFVRGNLVSGDILVGSVVEAESDYIVFEYWVKVDKHTLGKISDL